MESILGPSELIVLPPDQNRLTSSRHCLDVHLELLGRRHRVSAYKDVSVLQEQLTGAAFSSMADLMWVALCCLKQCVACRDLSAVHFLLRQRKSL